MGNARNISFAVKKDIERKMMQSLSVNVLLVSYEKYYEVRTLDTEKLINHTFILHCIFGG